MNALVPWNTFGLPYGIPQAAPPGWLHVAARFARLLEGIGVPQSSIDDGMTKALGIVTVLNKAYWPRGWSEAPGKLVGSWGKHTRVHPSGDLDLLYLLPPEVFDRFAMRQGNRQSQLLQEMKETLKATYPRTDLRGDGQVVVVDFFSIKVEVVPAFLAVGGGVVTCDTNSGGRYRGSDPAAEVASLDRADRTTSGRARALVRLMKLWKRTSGVDIPSFAFEILAVEFLATYEHAHQPWWDWLVRDFLAFLHCRADTWICFPVTGEPYWLGRQWGPAAMRALRAAEAACAYEQLNFNGLAADQWCAVFGRRVLGS